MFPDTQPANMFYTVDGLTTEGPYSADALKQSYSEGSLPEWILCSEPDTLWNYERWFPLAKLVKAPDEIGSAASPPENLIGLLQLYVGWFVGLNLNAGVGPEVVKLTNVASDFFTVTPRNGEGLYHFPMSRVLSVTEGSSLIEAKVHRPMTRSAQHDTQFWVRETQKRGPEWIRVKIEVLLSIQVDSSPRNKTEGDTTMVTRANPMKLD